MYKLVESGFSYAMMGAPVGPGGVLPAALIEEHVAIRELYAAARDERRHLDNLK